MDNPDRQKAAAAAVVVLVGVLALVAVWIRWPRGGQELVIEPALESGASAPLPKPVAVEKYIVHVAGAVKKPGVYKLTPGTRVYQAVQIAGGFQADALSQSINLAEAVADGQRVEIPVATPESGEVPLAAGLPVETAPAAAGKVAPGKPAPAPAPPKPSLPPGKLNVNRALLAQLELLPGIGPSLAARIIAYRTQNGPFKGPDDLLMVSGIGPKKLAQFEDMITY